MLNLLREGVNSIIIKVLLILGILIFISAGTITAFFKKEEYVLKIGDIKYTKEELNAEIEKRAAVMPEDLQGGQNLEERRNQALGDIIRSAVLLQESKRLDLLLSDDSVKYRIANDPYFQKDGKFSKELWDKYFNSHSVAEAEFIQRTKDMISEQQLATIFSSGRLDNQELINQLFVAIYGVRQLEVFKINKAAIQITKIPEDADLYSIYQNDPDRFTMPAKRYISYLSIDINDITPDASVSKEDIKSLYHNSAHLFTHPNRRFVKQLVFKTEQEALNAYNKIKSGKSIEEIASSMNLGKESFELGIVTKDMLPQELSDIIFQLKEKDVSKPINTSFGWHIFFVETSLPEGQKTFEESEEELIAMIQDEKRFKAFQELKALVSEDFLYDKLPISDVAKKYSLVVKTAELIDGDNNLQHIPMSLVEDVFTKHDPKERNGVAGAQGEYFFYEIESLQASSVRDFDSVKEELQSIWKDKEMRNTANELMQKVKLSSEGDLPELVSKYREKFAIQSDESTLSENFAQLIFTMRQGQFSKMFEDSDDYIVFKLLSIEERKGNDVDSLKGLIQRDFLSLQRDMMFEQYLISLQNRYMYKDK